MPTNINSMEKYIFGISKCKNLYAIARVWLHLISGYLFYVYVRSLELLVCSCCRRLLSHISVSSTHAETICGYIRTILKGHLVPILGGTLTGQYAESFGDLWRYIDQLRLVVWHVHTLYNFQKDRRSLIYSIKYYQEDVIRFELGTHVKKRLFLATRLLHIFYYSVY